MSKFLRTTLKKLAAPDPISPSLSLSLYMIPQSVFFLSSDLKSPPKAGKGWLFVYFYEAKVALVKTEKRVTTVRERARVRNQIRQVGEKQSVSRTKELGIVATESLCRLSTR